MENVGTKIDFLMKITSTRNVVLANALHFDASYISRIRNGKRGIPHNQPFIGPACIFFAWRITENYQRQALESELGLTGPWPIDPDEAAELLALWLNGSQPDGGTDAHGNAALTASSITGTDGAYEPLSTGTVARARLFFGDSGRRDSVVAFLTDLTRSAYTGKLLFQSDEDMSWLYENESFGQIWSSLLQDLINRGCAVKIIHTVSRDANEMWEGVKKWLPLYLCGKVDAYYYPRLRDGVRKRSLFVAPGRSVLVSDSVHGMQGDELCILMDNGPATVAIEHEFDAYRLLCRPLLESLPTGKGTDFASRIDSFLGGTGELVAARLNEAIVAVRGDAEAFVIRTSPPCMAYKTDETRLVAAVSEYLENLPQGAIGDAEARDLIASLAHEC